MAIKQKLDAVEDRKDEEKQFEGTKKANCLEHFALKFQLLYIQKLTEFQNSIEFYNPEEFWSYTEIRNSMGLYRILSDSMYFCSWNV